MSQQMNLTSSDLFSGLTDIEKEYAMKILGEMSDSGQSGILTELYYADFDEIPVDIDTFLEDDRYIGKSTNQGKSVYPFWRDILRKLFAPESKYNEAIFSGSIGIGKSTIAVIGMSYVLYNIMCLKSPQTFYDLQPSDKIVFSFFNINLDLSYGVAYQKLQAILQGSPWFMDHGTVSGTKTPDYHPGKGIELRVGSRTEHSLGQNIFCIDGNTKIKTSKGVLKIEDLENKMTEVFDRNNNLYDEAPVINTKTTTEVCSITLEDGTVITCSPEHKFLTEDGQWIMAKDINENTKLKEV